MKKLLTLFAMAATALFVSCTDSDSNNGPWPKLSVSTTPLTVNVGAEGTFMVTSDIEAPHDIAVIMTSSDNNILKINEDSKSVTITKGEKTATGKFTGVAAGKADIKITTFDAEISVPAVNVIVEEDASPANPKIIAIDLNFTSDPAPASGADWHALKFPSVDTNVGTWTSGYLGTTNKVDASDPGSKFVTCIDNYGMLCAGTFDNATGKVNLSIVEKDVDISSLDFIENVNYNKETASWYWPVVYSETYKSLAGKSGYIVMYFIYSNSDKEIEKAAYPAWIKVSVADNGAVTAEEMAINCSEESFKTGQKK